MTLPQAVPRHRTYWEFSTSIMARVSSVFRLAVSNADGQDGAILQQGTDKTQSPNYMLCTCINPKHVMMYKISIITERKNNSCFLVALRNSLGVSFLVEYCYMHFEKQPMEEGPLPTLYMERKLHRELP